MKFLVLFSLIALAAAAEKQAEEQNRDKRGLLGLGAYPGLGYAAPAYHAAPAFHAPIAVGYAHKVVAPVPAIKYVAPLPAVKVIQPAYIPSYTKLAYSSPLVSPYHHDLYDNHYGYGYGHGYGHGYGYGYGGYLH